MHHILIAEHARLRHADLLREAESYRITRAGRRPRRGFLSRRRAI